MSFITMPRVRLLTRTNLDPDSFHSVVIALVRALTALQVAAAHARAQLFPGLKGMEDPALWYQALAFFTGFAHQAVIVFFVLSGWLVGGSFLNKLHQPQAVAAYMIDRVSRLWIVLIPAFLLSLLIGMLMHTVDPATASFSRDGEFSAVAFAGNLVGLQDMLVPKFGGNFPLWSLANETWYYILFPLVVLPFTGRSVGARMAAAVAVVFIVWSLSASLMLYFSIWLMGVLFSRLKVEMTWSWRMLAIALFAAASVYYRIKGRNDAFDATSLGQDIVCSVLFLTLLSGMQRKADLSSQALRFVRTAATRLASFSFTLYVIHLPLLMLLRHLYRPLTNGQLSPRSIGDLGVYALFLLVVVCLSYLFHLPFEAQTGRLRAAIKRLVLRREAFPKTDATESPLQP